MKSISNFCAKLGRGKTALTLVIKKCLLQLAYIRNHFLFQVYTRYSLCRKIFLAISWVFTGDLSIILALAEDIDQFLGKPQNFLQVVYKYKAEEEILEESTASASDKKIAIEKNDDSTWVKTKKLIYDYRWYIFGISSLVLGYLVYTIISGGAPPAAGQTIQNDVIAPAPSGESEGPPPITEEKAQTELLNQSEAEADSEFSSSSSEMDSSSSAESYFKQEPDFTWIKGLFAEGGTLHDDVISLEEANPDGFANRIRVIGVNSMELCYFEPMGGRRDELNYDVIAFDDSLEVPRLENISTNNTVYALDMPASFQADPSNYARAEELLIYENSHHPIMPGQPPFESASYVALTKPGCFSGTLYLKLSTDNAPHIAITLYRKV